MPEQAESVNRADWPDRPETAARSGRRRLPGAAGFWVLAAAFLMLFFASAAASPLYGVYQARFGFSTMTLTAVFAVYVLVLLVTLLFFGSVSDFLGRRPVIVASLVFSAAACGAFLAAHGTGELFLARALQGVATGLASGAIGAALIELQPAGSERAALVTSAFSSAGLAVGALVTSALVQYGPAPTHLIWWLLLGVFVLAALAVLAMAEPGSPRPGVLASMRPRIGVPRQARGTFVAALPAIVAVWALGGLYFSLGPSLAAELAASPNLLWGGLVIFLLAGIAAGATGLCRAMDPRRAMLTGCAFLPAGVVVSIVAIATTTSAVFLVGTAVAGVGFGLTFMGSFRVIIALAGTARASLIAAVFIVSYLAFSIPALIAGAATSRFGLHSTSLVYAICVAALALIASVLLRRGGPSPAGPAVTARTQPLPGPCTVPPCFPEDVQSAST
ncbi:MAG TPA: MFS transporter [Streptosporangiaceae bacterium]|jgi:Major Facilitator Superfamily|nr:MFS transporter [Streptosporangiaceae bacterium]